MHKALTILCFLSAGILLPGCQIHPSKLSAQQEALTRLDHTLQEKAFIEKIKESHIADLRNKARQTENGYVRFEMYKSLYEEYERYDLDSALYYVHREEEQARIMNDATLINTARQDRANRYIISGMYRYAEQALDSIDITNASSRARVAYYRSLITLHHGLTLTNKDPLFHERLNKTEHDYRDQIFNAADTTVLYYYTYRAENELDRGRPERARWELERYLKTEPTSPDELSILHYCMGKSYLAEGNIDQALAHNAISAYYDISQGVRSSRSLIKTARLAMQKGQTEKAFSYITRAYEDATQADARICLEEISTFMPEIISSYDKLNKRRYEDVLLIVMLLAMFLAACIASLFIVRNYQVKILRSDRIIKNINQKLSSSVKLLESTLGRYLTMFTSHINSLEEYRSSIRVVAKSKDIEEITRALRSDDYIDAKRETLLREFDRTFLGVFPNFVEQLNALLREDQRIGQNLPAGKLTNELRIFALIRLGVTESADISRFLKKSPSTIYNYRVKLRNASIYSNEEFEKRLMEIGKA